MKISKDAKMGCLFVLALVGGIGLLTAIAIWLDWYNAGVKTTVYNRQGFQVSQWEVFCGAVPIERVVTIKEEKKQ